MPASRSRSWGPDAVTYAYRTDGRRVLLLCVDDEDLPALEPELAFMRAPLARQRSTGHEASATASDRISRPQSVESGVGCVTFQFNDLTCRTREHLRGVPGECLRT
ncbi:hypothetical protein ACVWXB_004558 [Streptomyces sp. TE12347]